MAPGPDGTDITRLGRNTKQIPTITRGKISGRIWIYPLIRNLWDTNWDIWNYRNHKLHTTNGQTKTEILACVNTIFTYHLNQGMEGLKEIYHLIFKTSIHTLLYSPVHQCLSWIVDASSARQCSQRNLNKSSNPTDIYQLLLSCIHNTCLIPELTVFNKTNCFITIARPDKTCSLFIEREKDIPLYQDPNHDQKPRNNLEHLI